MYYKKKVIVYDDYNSRVKNDQTTTCTITTNCGSSTLRNAMKIIEVYEKCSEIENTDVGGMSNE